MPPCPRAGHQGLTDGGEEEGEEKKRREEREQQKEEGKRREEVEKVFIWCVHVHHDNVLS